MTNSDGASASRYARQVVFKKLGLGGQRRLVGGRVLIAGVGGLGSWSAELLARSGVGFLRLVDNDNVDLTNIHRQALYDERDARQSIPKAEAAAAHLRLINNDITVKAVCARLDRINIGALAGDVNLIIDGTDNFASRFLINDYAVKRGIPWIFAGVVRAEAQTMTIVPHRTPCLRCVLREIPPECSSASCRDAGVLAPAVAAIAAFQAAEAIKLISGTGGEVNPSLMTFDMWTNRVVRFDVAAGGARGDCPCCAQGEYEFLEP